MAELLDLNSIRAAPAVLLAVVSTAAARALTRGKTRAVGAVGASVRAGHEQPTEVPDGR